MKEFLKGSFRTTVSIFFALVGLVIVIASYSAIKDFYVKQQLKPLEKARPWHYELGKSLGLDAYARTKFLDGNFMVSLQILGYPGYLLNPKNMNAALIFEFMDNDGFKIISKPIQLSEFTTIVDEQGQKTGLSYQFQESMTADRYQRLGQMRVLWTLATEDSNAIPSVAQVPSANQVLDHCEPNLSKGERLKRLAQYGKVRQTGSNRYIAGVHSLSYFSDGDLLGCQ